MSPVSRRASQVTRRTGRATRRTSLALASTLLALGLPAAAQAATAQATTPAADRPVAPPATPTVEGTTPGTPAQPPFDTTALQPALNDVVAPNIPGSAVGAVAEVRGATGRWASSAGWADLAAGTRAEATDQFRAASNTKPMVSVLALQEVESGRWTLQTRVEDVLPGLLPAGYGGVTLAQLLSHTSGMPDFDDAYVKGATDMASLIRIISTPRTNEALVKKALTQPWLFTPGTKWSYSNTNYVVVGMMLEQATGAPLGELLAARVFAPAGMTNTSYATVAFWPARHLTEYGIADKPYALNRFQPSMFGPAGAVTTTATDLSAFYRALVTGRLLTPKSVLTMATPVLPTTPYGLGLMATGDACTDKDGKQGILFGHTGATFGTMSFSFISPDGTRQVTLAYNGRDYVVDSQTFNTFLIAALQATCTTTPLGPGTPSGGAANAPATSPNTSGTGIALPTLVP